MNRLYVNETYSNSYNFQVPLNLGPLITSIFDNRMKTRQRKIDFIKVIKITLKLKKYNIQFTCFSNFLLFQAITVPSMAVTHIMLEAYKKYILVSLMVNGKVSSLPKYTSHVVAKYIKVNLTYLVSYKCIVL